MNNTWDNLFSSSRELLRISQGYIGTVEKKISGFISEFGDGVHSLFPSSSIILSKYPGFRILYICISLSWVTLSGISPGKLFKLDP